MSFQPNRTHNDLREIVGGDQNGFVQRLIPEMGFNIASILMIGLLCFICLRLLL